MSAPCCPEMDGSIPLADMAAKQNSHKKQKPDTDLEAQVTYSFLSVLVRQPAAKPNLLRSLSQNVICSQDVGSILSGVSKDSFEEERGVTCTDIKLIMPTVLILLFTLFIMVTVIPYAFSSVIKQLKAVRALEAAGAYFVFTRALQFLLQYTSKGYLVIQK